MKISLSILAAVASASGVFASPIDSWPATPAKVTEWPEHRNNGNVSPNRSLNSAANGDIQANWHVSIRIEAFGWRGVDGHYLQVEGDERLGINWLTLGPERGGQPFQWFPRDQSGSGVAVVGNIQHPALWGRVPVWAGFLDNQEKTGVNPLPVFMSAENGSQKMWWFEDLALSREGYLVRIHNNGGIQQTFESWIMCWTTYQPDQSQFLGLHWSTNGRYSRRRCGPVRLRMSF